MSGSQSFVWTVESLVAKHLIQSSANLEIAVLGNEVSIHWQILTIQLLYKHFPEVRRRVWT